MVRDKNNHAVGTVTLVMSEDSTLPVESIFSDEIEKLKNNYPAIAEVSRLVIDKKFRHSKDILGILFNHLAIYAYHVKHYDALLCQVNPKHVSYYQKLLKFRQIGKVKNYPAVNNAPAALQLLPLSVYQSEIISFHSKKAGGKKVRSLYSGFCSPAEEKILAIKMMKEKKIMSQADKFHFGLSNKTDLEICVK